MENKAKKKRGRPPKKKVEIPEFESESDLRKFLTQKALELSLEMCDIATKKNNVKMNNYQIAKTKTAQYKMAIDGLKAVRSFVDKNQIEEVSSKIKLLEETISTMKLTGVEAPEELSETLQNLNMVNQELIALKSD